MSNIVRKHVAMQVDFSKLVLSMALANGSRIIKSFCRNAFAEKSILTSYCKNRQISTRNLSNSGLLTFRSAHLLITHLSGEIVQRCTGCVEHGKKFRGHRPFISKERVRELVCETMYEYT